MNRTNMRKSILIMAAGVLAATACASLDKMAEMAEKVQVTCNPEVLEAVGGAVDAVVPEQRRLRNDLRLHAAHRVVRRAIDDPAALRGKCVEPRPRRRKHHRPSGNEGRVLRTRTP